MKDDSLGGFLIICPDCEKAGTKYHTMLYVNWEYGLYTITCETCKKSVCFDFMGKEVVEGDTVGFVKNHHEKEYIN